MATKKGETSTQNGAVHRVDEEGDNRILATYGDNYERLQEIKAEYDPENVFHVNQNIEPAP